MVKKSVGISFVAMSTILILLSFIGKTMWAAEVEKTLSNSGLFLFLTGLVCLSWGKYDESKRGKNDLTE
ncbi:hypothetical protein [Fredinandcohnia sp. 179-A 10B2 NHS]|uniref:hypothetical protein n=1 Tax=Fredinandcohnia sp. 179-A 10B2 NHS TaxID=3235176 RepID=UPI00399FF05D